MTDQLKDQIRNSFEQLRLGPDQLAQLRALQAPAENSAPSGITTRRWFAAALVASLVLGLALVRHYPGGTAQGIAQQIADEVATNHMKMRPLEVATADLDTARAFFTELDFSPTRATGFNQAGRTMLGGRYCSIKGIAAAQFRYAGTNQQTLTLYQTLYDSRLFGQLPQLEQNQQALVRYSKGLTVEIWVEKGILMASVAPGP